MLLSAGKLSNVSSDFVGDKASIDSPEISAFCGVRDIDGKSFVRTVDAEDGEFPLSSIMKGLVASPLPGVVAGAPVSSTGTEVSFIPVKDVPIFTSVGDSISGQYFDDLYLPFSIPTHSPTLSN